MYSTRKDTTYKYLLIYRMITLNNTVGLNDTFNLILYNSIRRNTEYLIVGRP